MGITLECLFMGCYHSLLCYCVVIHLPSQASLVTVHPSLQAVHLSTSAALQVLQLVSVQAAIINYNKYLYNEQLSSNVVIFSTLICTEMVFTYMALPCITVQ